MDPHTEEWKGRIEYATLSDVGLRRTNNQDSLAVMVAGSPTAWQQRGDLFMVADGMGAHAAGELASKISTDTVPLVYQKLADRAASDAAMAAIHEANTQIHTRGQGSIEFKGMGTTTTVLAMLPSGAVLAHVGDSRAYRIRADRIEQLTFDHSLVWEMKAAGQIEGPVPDYIPKNVITRSLGPNPSVQVDVEGPHPIQPGDTFLLCSDGLSGPVKDEEIGTIANCLPPADAVRTLVDLANLRGGPDNVTVVIARATSKLWTAGAGSPHETHAQVRPVHPTVWIAFGVLALAGLGLLGLGQWLPGAVTLGVAAVVLAGAFIYRQGGDDPAQAAGGRRMGRGPYTAANCPPTPAFAKQLADMVHDLHDAAKQGDMNIDHAALTGMLDQAAAATKAGDHARAIRQYSQALSFMISELKRLGGRSPGKR